MCGPFCRAWDIASSRCLAGGSGSAVNQYIRADRRRWRRPLGAPILPYGRPQRRKAMEKPAILKVTLAFVLGTGLAAALGLGILSAWAWSTPEVSISGSG